MGGQARHEMLNAPFAATKTKIRDRSDPFNEAFSFTPEQYARLKATRPDLFDNTLDPQAKVKLWKEFAQTTEGKAFRWR